MTLARALLQALKQMGAKQVWGIPGDFILPFFSEMECSGILPAYSLSHEPSVAFAADASARLDNGLGVVAVTYGAGALNIVNAVAQAYAERSPLVIIAGVPSQAELQLGLQLHHQVKTIDSQAHIFKEITCAQLRLEDAKSAPEDIALLLATCKEQSRPVLIEMPRNMSVQTCLTIPSVTIEKHQSNLEVEICLNNIHQQILHAQRPVIIAGVEVKRYALEAEFCQWAEKLNIPCFTTLMGKGITAEQENSPVLGTYLGDAGDSIIAETVKQADLIILVGVIMSDSNFAVGADTLAKCPVLFIQHREVDFGSTSFHGLSLRTVIEGLLPKTEDKSWCSLAQLRDKEPFKWPRSNKAAIKPLMIAAALNECFERYESLPVSCDVGDCLFVSQALKGTGVVAPGYYASMGFAVPAGLAIQATTKRRPVILVGDGAFQMTGMELGHCRRYDFTPIVIVLNNRGWEMIRAFSPNSKAAELGHWPFAAMANVFIGEGVRVSTHQQLREALMWAFEDPTQAYVIDVQIAPGCRTPSLEHFSKILTEKQKMAR